ncbi:hypothetical protein [Lewinella sp. W8]|uniref:hypothetical protein n=1 Tax=Lewinella sp. W8 TaxID=2528208 RepID=UPI0010687B82|nr:hypothetical protein [Lewinella sp. W8]MTB51293.1 hypothetical protein [Lewinella sp. W8]
MRIYLSLFALCFLIFACEEDRIAPSNVSETDAQRASEAVAEVLNGQAALQTGYDQTQINASQEPELGNLTGDKPEVPSLGKSLTCPAVTFTSTPETFFPATLGLAYDGCNDEGRLLDGSITAVFNGLLLSAGTDIALSFADFSVDNTRLSGTYVVSNTGLDEDGRQSFSSVVEDAVFFRDEVQVLTYTHDWRSVQVEGQETNFFNAGLAGIFDDEYDETYVASGTTVTGEVFSITTEVPVRGELDCRHKTSGKLVFDFAFLEGTPAVLDFGDGSCDNQATVTVGEFVYPIEL